MWNRRKFLAGVGATTAAGALGASGLIEETKAAENRSAKREGYRGPNVIVVRFGGGVRRRETIDHHETFSPFLRRVLAPQGVIYPKMEIANAPGVVTSHGQGTLYLLTGRYDEYKDVSGRPFSDRFEPKVPTVFETLRKNFDVPEHQALLINGEDRIDEEFYTFSNHHLFGVHYKSTVLSLYRFKLYILRRDLDEGRYKGKEEIAKRAELRKLQEKDIHARDAKPDSPELNRFWEKWAAYYGKTGLVNPRGDRLLTELAVRAIRELRPKLLMINYNDPDYVHWGNPTHYTRGISIIDEGLRTLWETVEREEGYRDNTLFLIVPDCGRDANPFMSVPFQHHFGGPSSHEIFLVAAGKGVDRGRVVDKKVEQVQVARTIAQAMGFAMLDGAQGDPLAEVFA